MEELKKYLKFNKKTEIERLLPNRKLRSYKTALYKEDEHEFYFFKPREDDCYINFRPNETIRILIYTLEGIFTFKSKITRNGTKLVKVKKPEFYKKIQRRALLRVNLPIKVNIQYKKEGVLLSQDVKIVDISGGGISFNTDCELFDIKRILVNFKVEDKPISSYGEIIEIRKNRKPQNGKYRLSIRFLSLSRREVEFIVKHCIIYQIKTRMKEKDIISKG